MIKDLKSWRILSVSKKGGYQMTDFIFAKGYREQVKWRKSFFELAQQVFGIHFDSWYEKKYWTDKYIPFSYIDREKVIANVSVNFIDLLIGGELKRGIQIGTVMTHPDYRNLGLSKKLLNQVIEEYRGSYDMMYLFANKSVLDFYPKFGFKPLNETQFSINYIPSKDRSKSSIKRLSGNNDSDLNFIYQFAKNRIPVSSAFSTANTEELLQFYCINVFPNDIYYLENEEAIIIYQKTKENDIHIYDIISQKEVNIEKIVHTIASEHTKKVVFHFTIDQQDELNIETITFHGNEVLFVRFENEVNMPKQFKHPMTSQA